MIRKKTCSLALSKSLIKALDKERPEQFNSRSEYVEHLLRTHPYRQILFDDEGNPKTVEEACDGD